MEKKQFNLRLGFHKFFTIVYLPLSIAFSVFVAIGNYFSIGRLELTSLFSYIEAVSLMLPYVAAVLNTVALIGLLGFTSFGRRTILFSETFKILLLLFVIFGNMVEGNMVKALIASLIAIFDAFVYGYYKSREEYFVVGGRSYKETRAYFLNKDKKEEVKMPNSVCPCSTKSCSALSEKTTNNCCAKKVEEPKVEEPKVEEPKTEEPKTEEPKTEELKTEEPKVEEPKVEEPKVEEPKVEGPKTDVEKEEEQKMEETKKETVIDELKLTPFDGEVALKDTIKKTTVIYSNKDNDRVKMISSTLILVKDKTILNILVDNPTDETFVKEEWLIQNRVHYISEKELPPKAQTTLSFEINRVTDRLSISLLSLVNKQEETTKA